MVGPGSGELKASLAHVLVPYYAFAGVMVVHSAGEPDLLCNNSGVEFIEASPTSTSNISFSIIPMLLSTASFCPRSGKAFSLFRFDHRVADAYSASMFLNSWAEMCRSSSSLQQSIYVWLLYVNKVP
ncbi:hypothetical protein CDL15_Pgr015458 [Punica granatum]|uniref:Uncharacterized protein n=1 Tax=Punica granatum TaxID=22663 RepID=A0A218W1N0_PUNGR|nr:hypothetical protein CDL15_Pgr015458 [Punica granatum]PKI66661.1 hypothetical protein CRG98_012856 [Punica granatum]